MVGLRYLDFIPALFNLSLRDQVRYFHCLFAVGWIYITPFIIFTLSLLCLF